MMNRGDVYQADLEPTKDSEQAGCRPVVIVSRNSINRSSPVVVVVPVTTYISKRKIYPSHCFIKANTNNGLSVDSIVKCEQIRAITKSRLSRKWGTLDADNLTEIDAALKITLSLS
jgi:mRNA interferase MazF